MVVIKLLLTLFVMCFVLNQGCCSDRPVPIILSIGFIVLGAIAHQIGQGKAIMTGDEIATAVRPFARLDIEVSAAADPAGHHA